MYVFGEGEKAYARAIIDAADDVGRIVQALDGEPMTLRRKEEVNEKLKILTMEVARMNYQLWRP